MATEYRILDPKERERNWKLVFRLLEDLMSLAREAQKHAAALADVTVRILDLIIKIFTMMPTTDDRNIAGSPLNPGAVFKALFRYMMKSVDAKSMHAKYFLDITKDFNQDYYKAQDFVDYIKDIGKYIARMKIWEPPIPAAKIAQNFEAEEADVQGII